jgi:hypothetical protein
MVENRRRLPNYDPDFCLKVTKWGASICLGLSVAALCILTLVDSTNSRCPGWTFHTKSGQAIWLWPVVGLLTGLPTIWICFIAFRWEYFSQKVYDEAADGDAPPWMSKRLYARAKPDPVIFPYNEVFVIITIGWCLACTIPLWMMLANCANLPRYWGQ